MRRGGSVRSQSSGSEDSDLERLYSQNDDWFLGAADDRCIRCQMRVYPIERVEVGVQLHKNCFRCRECNMMLSLHSFILARVGDGGDDKDVFCKAHAPKPDKNRLDPEAIGIKMAVHSQQLNKTPSFNTQVRLTSDMAGWEYDPKAIEFEHAKILHERNKFRRPPSHDAEPDDIEYEKGELIRKLRHGELRKEKVKAVASTMADVLSKALHPKVVMETSQHLDKAKQTELRYLRGNARKFPTNTEYIEPNALWSPDSLDDPMNPRYLDRKHSNGDLQERDETLSDGAMSNGQCEEIYSDLPGSFLVESSSADHKTTKADDVGHEDADDGATSKGDGKQPITERIYEKLNILRPADGPGPARPEYDADRFDGTQQQETTQRQRQQCQRQSYENTTPHQCPTSRGRSGMTLRKTPPEYLKEKKFVEQNQLELRQRHEHDEMIRDLERVRGNQIQRLEKEARKQADAALDDLFSRMKNGTFHGDISSAKRRIEQRFRRMREEKMKHVMSDLTGQERMRIDDMINRQTQEMLELIDQKISTKLPPPAPPKSKKVTLYSSPDVFDEVDFYAVQVAQYETESFTELVFELTKNCKNTLEKTRAIFKWLTYKDLNLMMFSDELLEDSPYYFLKGIKYGLESYHELFKRLCSYAGIPVKIIRGVSKSAGYRPGMTFDDDSFRNSWAVVYIDDSWRFVDCHWGARHVNNPDEPTNPRCFCYELDEFYFLTDPEDIVYMHFPDAPEWQLLERPLTLERFVRLPVLKSHFFQYHIRIKGDLGSVLSTESGRLQVVVAFPRKQPLAFSARLELGGVQLTGYCLHHYDQCEAYFDVALPEVGSYFLTLFACDKDRGDTYNNVCSFRVDCAEVSERPFARFPALPDGYGLTPVGVELGLSADKRDGHYLVCDEDRMILNVRFACPVIVSQKLAMVTPDGRVVHLICGDGGRQVDLDLLTFQRYKDHCFVSYVVRFVQRAFYVFSIYAGYSQSKSQSLECACRYLIQYNGDSGGAGDGQLRVYPRTLQFWQKCRLYEPTSGELKVNRNIRFRLEVFKAEAVAVIVGKQWFYLRREENGQTWGGVVATGKNAKLKAEVYACFSNNDRDFFPLLEYRLVKEESGV